MASKFNEQTGLYEQVNVDNNQPDVNSETKDEVTTTERAAIANGNTGKLHAFKINSSNLDSINQLISGQIKEWKSENPLIVLGKDGTLGGEAMLNGKPLYLMLRIASKKERASSELQLELSDRIYLLLNTSTTELSSILKNADNMDHRVNVAAKGPNGVENTVAIWSENVSNEPTPDDSTKTENTDNVNVDMEAQIENPGTAAGISGTVEEGINEQDAKFNTSLYDPNKQIKDKGERAKGTEDIAKTAREKAKYAGLNEEQTKVMKSLGAAGKRIKMSNGGYVVKLNLTKGNTGVDGVAYFYSNGRMYIKTKAGGKILAKTTYRNGGKTISVDGGATVKSGSVYQNLKDIAKNIPTESTESTSEPTFKTQEEGDAFRAWANSTDELKKKYGKESKFDLDTKGKFNNSYINNAFGAAKEDYLAYMKNKKNFKYKEGDIVYYRTNSDGKVDIVKNSSDDKIKGTVNKQKKEMEKDRKTTPVEDQYNSVGANPNTSESIATSFDMYKQITEEGLIDELSSKDVDSQAGLIKDMKAGNLKKGKVIKQIDDDTIKVINTKSEKEETIKLSNIVPKEDARNAALKIKASRKKDEEKDKEKEKKTDLEKSEEKLNKEKEETKSIKQKLKDKRKEKRNLKRTNRKDNRQKRKKKKIEKVQSKIDDASESVVYDFSEFIEKTNKLN